MAARRGRQADSNAEARRRMAPAATNGNRSREGHKRVFGFGKKGKKDREVPPEELDRLIEQFGKKSPLYQRCSENKGRPLSTSPPSAPFSWSLGEL